MISLHKATLNRWSNKGILQNLTTTDSKLKCHQSFPLWSSPGPPGHRSIAKTRVVISMRVWPSRKSVVRRCFFFWLCIVVLGHFRRLIWWVSECACNRAGGVEFCTVICSIVRIAMDGCCYWGCDVCPRHANVTFGVFWFFVGLEFVARDNAIDE